METAATTVPIQATTAPAITGAAIIAAPMLIVVAILTTADRTTLRVRHRTEPDLPDAAVSLTAAEAKGTPQAATAVVRIAKRRISPSSAPTPNPHENHSHSSLCQDNDTCPQSREFS
jgi:hypothetical protein